MFTYRIMYQKHEREEGATGPNLVLRTIEKTTSGDVHVITAGIQCAMFVETYGKKDGINCIPRAVRRWDRCLVVLQKEQWLSR